MTQYDSFYEKHYPNSLQPGPVPFALHKDDRLLLIGDSITEVRRYSLMLETYLAACMPHLEVEVRNIGKGGETAKGFLNRIDTECLNYKPTAATLCYGMNDAGYLNNNREGADKFRTASAMIVKKLKAAGARMVIASPGCIGRLPSWEFVRELNGSLEGINTSLMYMRDEAAALLESLVGNHAFVDGNKRTAITAAGLFLRLNGFRITASNQELEDFTLQCAQHRVSLEQMTLWFESQSEIVD